MSSPPKVNNSNFLAIPERYYIPSSLFSCDIKVQPLEVNLAQLINQSWWPIGSQCPSASQAHLSLGGILFATGFPSKLYPSLY